MPLLVISAIYFGFRVIFYFTNQEAPPVRVLSAAVNLFYCFLWLIFLKFMPTKTPMVNYIWLLHRVVFTNLSMRDMLPEVLLETEKNADEIAIVSSLIFSHSINYNEFIVVLIVNPLIVVISYYF